MPSRSARRFATHVRKCTSLGAGTFPLTNFTFFLGAGFSKSWDIAFPIGTNLFQVAAADRDQLLYIERAANFSAAAGPHASLDMDAIKRIAYTLDMNAKYDSIRSRYVDNHNIRFTIEQLRAFFTNRLQQLVAPNWHWFDPVAQKFQFPAFSHDQEHIRDLFRHIFPLIDGSLGFMQGARFNFITTNYDWLVEFIIDSICDNDDSVFLYLYRGITPKTLCDRPVPIPTFAHSLVFNLLKLNGGIEVIRRLDKYHLDYRFRTADAYREEPPVLMLPSREQDYFDEYFISLFPKAVRLLQESKVLVLVGYSLPEEDALLRFVIRHFCENEADAPNKAIFYVDMMSRADQLSRLQSVFPFAGTTLETHTFSGSFAEWAGDVAGLL